MQWPISLSSQRLWTDLNVTCVPSPRLEPVAGKNKGGTDGFFLLSPLCNLLPLFISQTQFQTPPGTGVYGGGKERGHENSYLSGTAVSWKLHLWAYPVSEGVSFMGCLGSAFTLHTYRSWLRTNPSPSQLIACSFLSSWKSGNREGKPSPLRSVHSSSARN